MDLSSVTSVTIIQNGSLFYVVDEVSKLVFEKKLGLPFDMFDITQKDCVSALLKRAKYKVNLLHSSKVINESITPFLDEWKDHQPFKKPIKKKYSISDEFTHIEFAHLGPTTKTAVQKADCIQKCQDSIHPFMIRVWEQLEPHFYMVKMFDSTVEIEKHRDGTIIKISYPLVHKMKKEQDEEGDE